MNRRFKLVVVSFSTILVVLLLLGSAMGRSVSAEDAYRHLAVYTEVLSRIKSEYVEEPDVANVTLGAMNGLLEAIDPYASYLSADQYKQYLQAQNSKKATPGLVLSRKFGYVGVVNALPGSSAEKAGLTTGDMLEAINGVGTRDMPLAYAEMLLQGEPGSSVEISVLRLRNPEPQKITLTRQPVRYSEVTSKMLPDSVGLIHVAALDAGKSKDVAAAIEALSKQGANRFIIDLRSNSIGTPEEGLAVADLFLDKGLLGYLQGQKVARRDFKADEAKTGGDAPLVLITNRGTAGAAELAAAALLESKRAEVVGERTYGDAAVRRAITLEDGSAVILSVAKYHSPSGKAVQDTGVTPTVPVAEIDNTIDIEGVEAPQPAPKTEQEDLLLKRAIEVVTKGKPAGTVPLATTPKEHEPPRQKPLTIEEPEKK